MGGFYIIAEYNNHSEAEMAKELLESNGIKSVVHSDDGGGIAGGQTFIRGVQLMVFNKDVENARKILNLKHGD
jgi:hypothetical protein